MATGRDPDYLERGGWRSDKVWVSHWDYDPSVLRELHFPDKIVLHDVTLRDGEQTPGVVFRREEKIRIAQALDVIGVHRIEAGMPVVSEEDFQAVKDIANLGLHAQIYGFCRLRKEDIDAAMKADVYGVIAEGPVGYPKLRYQHEWDEDHVVQIFLDIADYCQSHGLRFRFFGVDSTRADFTFLSALLERLEEETKVEGFVIADTYGSLTPEAARHLFSALRHTVKKPLEFHGHNDFGLGTATSIAALSSGAEAVHVSVNGIGERAGNASLEEVALSLKLLYNRHLSISFDKLYQLSRLVEELSRFKLAPNKPVVGERVFTRESGIGVAGWLKYHLASEPYLPELVGNKHDVLIGKKSGRHSIEWKLGQMGLKAAAEEVAEILRLVKNKSEEKKGPLTDEQFQEIVDAVKAATETSC